MKSLLPAPRGPASVNDIRRSFAAGHQALQYAPEVDIAGAASAPPVGSAEYFAEQRRKMFEAAPDLRASSRRAVDETWSSVLSNVETRFGRAVDLDEWNQRGPGELMALKRARACEAQYIALASAGGSQGAVSEAWDKFCAATAAFLNEATAGWKRVDGGRGGK